MDGQTEHVNQKLDQFLHLFVNEQQNDWYNLLPITEFQYNNHVHSMTQQPLFLLDTGQIPHMGFKPRQNPSSLETVYHKWSLTICDGCFNTLKSSKMQS